MRSSLYYTADDATNVEVQKEDSAYQLRTGDDIHVFHEQKWRLPCDNTRSATNLSFNAILIRRSCFYRCLECGSRY